MLEQLLCMVIMKIPQLPSNQLLPLVIITFHPPLLDKVTWFDEFLELFIDFVRETTNLKDLPNTEDMITKLLVEEDMEAMV